VNDHSAAHCSALAVFMYSTSVHTSTSTIAAASICHMSRHADCPEMPLHNNSTVACALELVVMRAYQDIGMLSYDAYHLHDTPLLSSTCTPLSNMNRNGHNMLIVQ
jgi:hypothetical protein